MCRAFGGTILARLARFHIAVSRHYPTPKAKTPSDHPVEMGYINHFGYS